jgi:AcrR family transcriptional regulator
MATGARPERGGGTRELILSTAERLFAEQGVQAVSNRQIAEAAGQANPAVVAYHFGARTDLVRAIMRRHAAPIDEARLRLLAEIGDSCDIHDWAAVAVRPTTGHLAALGSPSWYARLSVQVVADPVLHGIVAEDSAESVTGRLLLQGVGRCLAGLPADVLAERGTMVRYLIFDMCAERERALATGAPTPHPSWDGLAASLVDAIGGLWLAPVARRPARGVAWDARGRS